MSETNERRPLPAGWGWYSVNGFDHIARSRDRARRGYYLAHVLAETWNVFASEADDAAEIAGDTAASPEAARAAAEAECWARGLFGADAAPAAQPSADPPWRWGAMRFSTGVEKYGRFHEEPWCGTWRIVVDELNDDGTFLRALVPVALLEVEVPHAEDAVRAAALPERDSGPCDGFTEPSARLGRCRHCGHDKAAHEAKRAGVPWEPVVVQVAGD